MIYRGYTIHQSEWFPGNYGYFHEGEKMRTASSISEAKQLIDQEIFEKTLYTVLLDGVRFTFFFLTEALDFIKEKGAVPMFQFDSI